MRVLQVDAFSKLRDVLSDQLWCPIDAKYAQDAVGQIAARKVRSKTEAFRNSLMQICEHHAVCLYIVLFDSTKISCVA
jgi:hypothetical protein